MSTAVTDASTPAAPPAPSSGRSPESTEPRSGSVLREIMTGNAMVTVLAIVLSLVISGLLIIFTNEDVLETTSYLFARPGDFFAAAWAAISGAYSALFRGAIFNYTAPNINGMLYPITETLTVATPLIIISLGVAVAFRSGLFNIGAQGQMIIGAMFATFFGVHLQLPLPLHLLLVLIMGALGGALWGAIVGVLKAWTGAHEVILTIMLNYVAVNLVTYLLYTPLLQREGSANPVSDFLQPTALFPQIFGSAFRLHWGFVVALVVTAFTWWLLNRSTWGFRLKTVGANPAAARTAGISVPMMYVVGMSLSGAYAGLAGMTQVSGTEKVLNTDVAGSFGFDAITVALLGRSNPIGVLFAGLLFGALRAGGVSMQAQTGVPIDVVLVVQSLIVLFIAAPPLVRAIFRLPQPSAAKARRTADPVTQPALAGAATGVALDGQGAPVPADATGALESDDAAAASVAEETAEATAEVTDDGPPHGSHPRPEDVSTQHPASDDPRRAQQEGEQL